MASFDEAQAKQKKLEGGYTDHPKDKGNWLAVNGSKFAWVKGTYNAGYYSSIGGKIVLVGTKYGIAAPTLAFYYGRPVTADEMKNLPYETAVKIYKKLYWDSIKGDEIKNQSVASLIYDSLTQHSDTKVAEMLTEVLGRKVTIPMKAADVSVINSFDQQQLFERIKAWREKYYKSLKQPSFEQGWLNRLNQHVFTGISKAAGSAAGAVKENPVVTIALAAGLFFLGRKVYRYFKKKR